MLLGGHGAVRHGLAILLAALALLGLLGGGLLLGLPLRKLQLGHAPLSGTLLACGAGVDELHVLDPVGLPPCVLLDDLRRVAPRLVLPHLLQGLAGDQLAQHPAEPDALASDHGAAGAEAEVLCPTTADGGHGVPVVPLATLAGAVGQVLRHDTARQLPGLHHLAPGELDEHVGLVDVLGQLPDQVLALPLEISGHRSRDEHLDVRPVHVGRSLQLASRVDALAELLGRSHAQHDRLAAGCRRDDLQHLRQHAAAVLLDLGLLLGLHRQSDQGVDGVRGAGRHALTGQQVDREPVSLLAHLRTLGPLALVCRAKGSASFAIHVTVAHHVLQCSVTPNSVD